MNDRIIITKVANGYILDEHRPENYAIMNDTTYVFNDLYSLYQFLVETYETKKVQTV